MNKKLEIYNSIQEKFKELTSLDIAQGSVLDNFLIASSYGIDEAYQEIEKNKTPHIYTSLTGKRIDDLGVLVGCNREAGEEDQSYLFRVLKWNISNQSGNSTAIETALMNLEYASNAQFVPFTHGVGTGSVYVIPKSLDENTIALALSEVKKKLEEVTSKSSFIEYIVPEILPVKIIAIVSFFKDSENVKENIQKKMNEYINNIKPGDKIELGELNKIGVNEHNIEYFAISHLFIGGKEIQALNTIQKLESKMVFDKVEWREVDK